MSAVIESETRFPGAPVPAYTPSLFGKLNRMSATEAFFIGGYRRMRFARMIEARCSADQAVRRQLVRLARMDNRELVRWLKVSR
jgi:hypothetical protein